MKHPSFALGFETDDNGSLAPFTEPEPYQPVLDKLDGLLASGKVGRFKEGRFRLICQDDGAILTENRRAVSANAKAFQQLEALAFEGSRALAKALAIADRTDIEGSLAQSLAECAGDMRLALVRMVFCQIRARSWSRFDDRALNDAAAPLPFPKDGTPFAKTVHAVVLRRIERFLTDPDLRAAADSRIC